MNNQTILLIDYDPASISKTATPLTKAGYQVEVAKDGLSGLAAFERMKPALVLVEAMLPRKHGFEVCQEIKARPEGKATPVLITTAVCRGRKYRMDALQIYGCDEYIEKPITDEELLKMIERFVQQANEAREQLAQDLSKAIDEVSPNGAAPDGHVAIETMDDDELEAKIDALLEGGDPAADQEAILGPPTDVSAAADAPAAERDLTAIDQAEDQPAALSVEAEPASEPPVAEEPSAAPVQETSAPETTILDTDTDWFAPQPEAEMTTEPVEVEPSAPAVEIVPESPSASTEAEEAVPAVQEPTEIAGRGKGRSKLVPIGVAAVLVLGAIGFLAFQQGWIGGGPAVEPVAQDSPAPPVSTPRPQALVPPVETNDASSLDPAALETEVAAQVDPEPVAPAEAQSQPSEPKPELPPKPQRFEGRSKSEVEAAQKRQRQANRALSRAAGSLQSQLLATDTAESTIAVDETVAPVDVNDEIPLGEPVRPKAQRGELYPLSEVDEAPTHIRFEQPDYDDIARRMNQEGVVLVEVLIDETGTVTETRLIQKIPNSRLNDATLRAALRWTYEPAIKDGVPVMVWKPERIAFELE